MNRRFLRRALIYIVAIIFVMIAIFPFIWAIIQSFMPNEQLFSRQLNIIPKEITLMHYEELFFTTNFLTYLKNSIIATSVTVLLTTILGSLGAYGLTRFKFRGRDTISLLMLLSYMFPGIVIIIPLYIMFVRFHLADTYFSLIISYTAISLPLAIWILSAFFRSISFELEEAAYIDGASRFTTFYRIIFPLALPGIVTSAVFTFSVSWTEYLFALVLISNDALKTFPLGLAFFLEAHGVLYGMLIASSVLVTVPVLILFIFIQKHLMKGFGIGTVF